MGLHLMRPKMASSIELSQKLFESSFLCSMIGWAIWCHGSAPSSPKNDTCIRDHIISKSSCVYGATNILADNLLPNKTVKETIQRILESNNSSCENDGSVFQSWSRGIHRLWLHPPHNLLSQKDNNCLYCYLKKKRFQRLLKLLKMGKLRMVHKIRRKLELQKYQTFLRLHVGH